MCYVQHWTPTDLEIWKAFHTQKKKKKKGDLSVLHMSMGMGAGTCF